MKLIERLSALLKSLASDILGEETGEALSLAQGDGADAERLAGLLEEAQGRLDALRLELADANGRQKRIALAWQEAQQNSQALDAAVDAALQAGEDDQARTRLVQAQRAQANAKELDELHQASGQLAEQIRAAVADQQERLALLRGRYQALVDRERTAKAMDDLLRAQKELAEQQSVLQKEFQQREAQIAQREDRLAARREWNR